MSLKKDKDYTKEELDNHSRNLNKEHPQYEKSRDHQPQKESTPKESPQTDKKK